MIGYLRGLIRYKQNSPIVLETNGVGYELHIPSTALQELPETGEQAEFHVHMQVREDAHTLFGFTNLADRDMFRKLITVSQIGPRIALGILSELRLAELVASVQLEDTRVLEKVPGIGKKTAERLLIELRDKISQFPLDKSTGEDDDISSAGIVREATEALIELGFSHREARQAVLLVREGADTTEEIIRRALGTLSVAS